MKVLVKDIPESGKSLKVDFASDGWFADLVTKELKAFRRGEEGASLEITLRRTGPNVTCLGELVCETFQECSRCLKNFTTPLTIELHLTLAPMFDRESVTLRPGEEIELSAQDLEFAFYEGDCFDLGSLVREHLILGLPMQSLCREDCKGLCAECGKDLNRTGCSCEIQKTSPQWEILKGLKLDEQK